MAGKWWIILGLFFAGCQVAVETPALPTVVDLNAISTDDAATSMAIASPTRRPLPATFTPSPVPSLTPTDPASVPTPTPEGYRANGTIYYIFEGDAIVELAADGSFEDLLPIPHIGQEISGLSLSPDDTQLAYVAPGAGSAREIYITDRKGTTSRRVSELGFGVMGKPVWKPDGSALAFIAAQSPEAPQGIYVVNADGSGQQMLVQLPTMDLRDVAWSSDGQWLFFSNETLYAIDVATSQMTASLTQFTGWGPDFNPVASPSNDDVYYLKSQTNLDTGQHGGVLSFFEITDLPDPPRELPGAALYVDYLEYSRDGESLLIAGDEGVWVQDQIMQTATKIAQDWPALPRPTFSPDAGQVALIGVDGLGVEQVFILSRQGGEAAQITFHQEGAVSDLNWAAG